MCILILLSDAKTTRKQAVNVPKKTSNGVSSTKKPPAPTNLVDDFSALFGGRCCENMSLSAIGYYGLTFLELFLSLQRILYLENLRKSQGKAKNEERPDGIVNREQRAVWYVWLFWFSFVSSGAALDSFSPLQLMMISHYTKCWYENP